MVVAKEEILIPKKKIKIRVNSLSLYKRTFELFVFVFVSVFFVINDSVLGH